MEQPQISKTQAKRAKRATERDVFIAQRRAMQLAIFERNFEVGLSLYEAQKDSLSPEEIEAIEAQIAENKAIIQKLKDEANPSPQA
mgnify:FL=1